MLSVTHSYSGDELAADFTDGLNRLGLSEYRYCLALPAADRSLKEIIDKEVLNLLALLVQKYKYRHSKYRHSFY